MATGATSTSPTTCCLLERIRTHVHALAATISGNCMAGCANKTGMCASMPAADVAADILPKGRRPPRTRRNGYRTQHHNAARDRLAHMPRVRQALLEQRQHAPAPTQPQPHHPVRLRRMRSPLWRQQQPLQAPAPLQRCAGNSSRVTAAVGLASNKKNSQHWKPRVPGRNSKTLKKTHACCVCHSFRASESSSLESLSLMSEIIGVLLCAISSSVTRENSASLSKRRHCHDGPVTVPLGPGAESQARRWHRAAGAKPGLQMK